MSSNGPLRVGIGGPVGSGKTTITAALCQAMRDDFSIGVECRLPFSGFPNHGRAGNRYLYHFDYYRDRNGNLLLQKSAAHLIWHLVVFGGQYHIFQCTAAGYYG